MSPTTQVPVLDPPDNEQDYFVRNFTFPPCPLWQGVFIPRSRLSWLPGLHRDRLSGRAAANRISLSDRLFSPAVSLNGAASGAQADDAHDPQACRQTEFESRAELLRKKSACVSGLVSAKMTVFV
jgi:hypothetical protein